MKVLSIHGYHGDPQNSIAKALAAQGCEVISPAIDYDSADPEALFAQLAEQAASEQADLLAGTSFGGFFAACLSAELSLPVILVNPCLLPFFDLPRLSYSGNLRPLMRLFAKLAALDNRKVSCIVGEKDSVLRSQEFTVQLTKNERFVSVPEGEHFGWTLPLETYLSEILPKIHIQR